MIVINFVHRNHDPAIKFFIVTVTILYWCYFSLTLGFSPKNCLPKSKYNYLQISSASMSLTYHLRTAQLQIRCNKMVNSLMMIDTVFSKQHKWYKIYKISILSCLFDFCFKSLLKWSWQNQAKYSRLYYYYVSRPS